MIQMNLSLKQKQDNGQRTEWWLPRGRGVEGWDWQVQTGLHKMGKQGPTESHRN